MSTDAKPLDAAELEYVRALDVRGTWRCEDVPRLLDTIDALTAERARWVEAGRLAVSSFLYFAYEHASRCSVEVCWYNFGEHCPASALAALRPLIDGGGEGKP